MLYAITKKYNFKAHLVSPIGNCFTINETGLLFSHKAQAIDYMNSRSDKDDLAVWEIAHTDDLTLSDCVTPL